MLILAAQTFVGAIPAQNEAEPVWGQGQEDVLLEEAVGRIGWAGFDNVRTSQPFFVIPPFIFCYFLLHSTRKREIP
jgi:hypothetical protein